MDDIENQHLEAYLRGEEPLITLDEYRNEIFGE